MNQITQFVALLSILLWASTGTAQEPPQLNDDGIAPGDTVRVKVAGHPDLSSRYTVDESGRVTLPLGDPVDASGLTPAELEQAVIASLKPDYLINPRVSVRLVDDGGKSVDSGEFAKGEPAQVNVDSLRVRRDPSLQAPTIGGLTGGTDVIVTERSEDWCAVETAGGRTPEGWVACRLLIMAPDRSAHIDHDFQVER